MLVDTGDRYLDILSAGARQTAQPLGLVLRHWHFHSNELKGSVKEPKPNREWKVEWKVENGEWKVESGKWKVE